MTGKIVKPSMAKPVDAAVNVTVSPDMLEASISITPPANGGKKADSQVIGKALRAAHITYGIVESVINGISETPEYSKKITVAKGIPPQDGKDGEVRYLFNSDTDIHPHVRENGYADFKDLNIVHNVSKGQVLCSVRQATPGTEGISVTGKKLRPTAGKRIPYISGSNTSFNENETELCSTIDGQVKLDGARVNVLEVFNVSGNVDNSTGNIKFVGSVNVSGNVEEGFVIDAGGNVQINGVVYGSNIISGGDVAIRGGIVGRNHGTVKCSAGLTCTYIENCNVETGGEIKAESIMNCNINCGASLELSGSHAKLIGGRCVVEKDITTNVIGSPSNLPTVLILGVSPGTYSRRAELERKYKESTNQSVKLSQIIKLLTQYENSGIITREKAKMLTKARNSLDELLPSIDQLKNELDKLKERIDNSSNGTVKCKTVAYPGVKITIGSVFIVLRDPVEASSFIKSEDKIKVISSY